MHDAARDTAIAHFYWRPAVCLFRALELDAYLDAGLRAGAPCLDLGCGDGNVSSMLLDVGLIDGQLIGLDLSDKQLARARDAGHYSELVQASAEALPFPDERFSSIVCNGVLEALPETPERAVLEAARVLRPGGLFFMTVPTDRFIPSMLWPRVLERISRPLATRYVSRFNRRLEHHGPYRSTTEWRRFLAAGGLELVYEQPFLLAASGTAYNILIMHVFRVLRVLKRGNRPPPAVWRRLLARTIESVERKDARRMGPVGGYTLFIARKPQSA